MLEEQDAVEKKYKEHAAEVKALQETIGKLEYQREFLKNTVREQDATISGLKGEELPAASSSAPKTELKRDFMAEKMARKVAEMPDVDPDIDLAAMRAKARAGAAGATDEEKKARGLLYDKSKASAIRDEPEEDDEGACDFGGGFDWE
jgi:hypothetical protein